MPEIYSCPRCRNIISPEFSDGTHCPKCGIPLGGLKQAKTTRIVGWQILVSAVVCGFIGQAVGGDVGGFIGLCIGILVPIIVASIKK